MTYEMPKEYKIEIGEIEDLKIVRELLGYRFIKKVQGSL
tara:strand:+ start:971 stop:1087 length:117 start_codon:yes stop_codon:yes gene_type:complete